MNTLGNASLQIVSTGAIATAVEQVSNGHNVGGIILALIGIVGYLVYEYTPNKVS